MKKLLLVMLVLALTSGLWAQKTLLPTSSTYPQAKSMYRNAMDAGMNADVEKMKDLLEDALEVDPNLFMAYAQLAMWDYQEGNDLGFKSQVTRAMALEMNRMNDAEQIFKEMLTRLSDDWRSDLTDLGAQLVEKYPDVVEAHVWKGHTHNYQQDFKGALAAYEKVTELDPDFGPVYNIMGYTYMYSGNMGEARRAFDRYIKLEPKHPNPYDSKGDFFMQAGIYKNAKEMYEKAVSMQKNFGSSASKIEAAAAMQVAEHETNSAFRRNLVDWASCYVHGPATSFTYVDNENLWHYQGWEEIYPMVKKEMFDAEGEMPEGRITRSNLQWETGEDMILLSYDQQVGEDGNVTRETRVMKKVEGEWKMLMMNAVNVSSFE